MRLTVTCNACSDSVSVESDDDDFVMGLARKFDEQHAVSCRDTREALRAAAREDAGAEVEE